MSFKLFAEKVIQLLVAHATFGHLLAVRREQFINRGAGNGLFNEVRGNRGDVLTALSRLLRQLGPCLVG